MSTVGGKSFVIWVPHGTEQPHSTHDIPHGTQISKDGIPHGTEHPHCTQDNPHGTHDIPHGTAHTLYRVKLSFSTHLCEIKSKS